jgi:hypothetical protein
MNFRLVKDEEITLDLLEEHPAWGQYYEPNDVATLVECNFSQDEVSTMLERVGWSDEYWFPIPLGTEMGKFQFEVRKAEIISQKKYSLSGYLFNDGHSIGIYGKKEEWIVNLSLLDLHQDELPALLNDLDIKESALLPLEIRVPSEGIVLRNWGAS